MANQRHEIATKPIVYVVDTGAVQVTANQSFTGAHGVTLPFDVYRPGPTAVDCPVVVFVSGYPNDGFRKAVGCELREMASYVSWARLFAAAGCAAVTYSAADPVADGPMMIAHLCAHAQALDLDRHRLVLWACSGNAGAALSVVTQRPDVRGMALLYPVLPASAASSVSAGVPLLLVRAGRDETPGVNASIDAFVAEALQRDLPITVINHPAAPHAFDILDACDASRAVIRDVRDFLIERLDGDQRGTMRGVRRA